MSESELLLEKLFKAVQRKCRECCGGSFKEVEECEMDKCALWPWRTASPTTAGEGPPPPPPEPIPSAKVAGAAEEKTPAPEKKPSSKKSSGSSQHTLF
jgi:hypothetical protein